VVAGLGVPPLTASATGGGACSFDPGTGQLTVALASGEHATLDNAGWSGPFVMVSDTAGTVSCHGATPSTTTNLVVTGAAGDEQFTLASVSGLYNAGSNRNGCWSTVVGQFVNGSVDMGPGTDRIVLDGTGGFVDPAPWMFGVRGEIFLGADGINYGFDGELNLAVSGNEGFTVDGSTEAELVDAESATYDGTPCAHDLTGAPVQVPVVLNSNGGEDVLVGGAADDTVVGADDSSTKTLYGMAGADYILGGTAPEILIGGASDDVLDGGPGPAVDVVSYADRVLPVAVSFDGVVNDGEAGESDVLTALEGITGGPGDDVLSGDGGDNVINGAGGADDISGGGGADNISGDGAASSGGADVINGGAGSDRLAGGPGDDVLHGDDDADVLVADPTSPSSLTDGDDTYDGGAGVDTADYSARTHSVHVSLDSVADDGEPDVFEADMVQTTIENVTTGSGADDVVGSSEDNDIVLGGGDDTAAAGDGADLIIGETGSDTLSGGAGPDHLQGGTDGDQLHGGADPDDVSGGDGDDALYGDADADDVAGGDGDDVLYGAAGDDVLHGDIGADEIRGGDNADSLFGGDGADSMYGEDGADSLRGEAGDDPTEQGGPGDDVLFEGQATRGGNGDDGLDGGNGFDILTYATRTGPVRFDSATGLAGHVAEALVPIENDQFAGMEELVGGNNADKFREGPTATGGERLVGGPGVDTVFYDERTVAVSVDENDVADDGAPGEGDDVRGDIEGVTTGDGNDVISLTDANNIVTPGAGNDVVHTFGGHDIVGSAGTTTVDGADLLDGGDGFDSISYSARTHGVAISGDSDGPVDGEPGEGDDVRGFEDIAGTAADDVLKGTSADDHLAGGPGSDILFGFGGNDQMSTSGSGSSEFYGGPGDDTEQVFCCDQGHNVFHEGAAPNGADTLIGGGTSVIDYSERDAAVGFDSVMGVAGDIATGEGDSVVAAGVLGGSGDDVIGFGSCSAPVSAVGNAGDDTVTLADCSGAVDLGAGADTLSFATAANAVTASMAQGTYSSSVASGTLVGVETLDGSPQGDHLTGAGAAETINGGAGDDVIAGAGGNDVEHGDEGDDRFDEGSAPNGADVIAGGAGVDVADYGSRPARSVAVSLDGAANDGAAGEGDNVQGDVESSTLAPVPPAILTVTRTGSGSGTVTSNPPGITCPSQCTHQYLEGETVALTANPAAGSFFAGWTGACTGNKPACTVPLAGNASASAQFTKKVFRTDGLVRLSTDKSFLGNGVYNTTASSQTRSTTARRTASRTFLVSVQNDGNVTDTFTVKGVGSGSGFTVKYVVGTKDVTKSVVAGTYRFTSVTARASRTLKIVVTVGSKAAIGASRKVVVTAVSTAASTRKDAVAALVKAVRS